MKETKIKKATLVAIGIIAVTIILSFLLNSCTPVQYVYIDPKDSVVRTQRVIHDDIYLHTPLYFSPYYRIAPQIIYTAPIRVPHTYIPRGRGFRH